MRVGIGKVCGISQEPNVSIVFILVTDRWLETNSISMESGFIKDVNSLGYQSYVLQPSRSATKKFNEVS